MLKDEIITDSTNCVKMDPTGTQIREEDPDEVREMTYRMPRDTRSLEVLLMCYNSRY